MQKCDAVEKVNRVPVSEAETVYATFCLGYITGFVDHYDLLDNTKNLKSKTFCLQTPGRQLTNTMLVETVLNYLRKNPEQQSLPLSEAVSISLEEAFPCSNKASQ